MQSEVGMHAGSRSNSSIIVSVRFGSGLAARIGCARETLALPRGSTVADLLSQLSCLHPLHAREFRSALAVVNGSHTPPASHLQHRQEVALLLAQAGG